MVALANRVKVNTATVGTGTVTLGASTSASFFTFAEGGITNGQTVAYLIEEALDFEFGTGVYTSAGTTMTRATVIGSKIGGTAGTSKMNLAGTAVVSIVALKDHFIYDGNVNTTAVVNVGSIELGAATDTTLARTAAGRVTVETVPVNSYTYSATAPTSPQVGDRWLDSDDLTLYTYVNDGDSSQWVSLVSAGATVQPTIDPQGRLTLTTAVPVTTADVTAATVVYYTPYKGNGIPISTDGSSFNNLTFSELSVTLGANWATNSNYDWFIASDSGTLRLCSGPAWTSDTGRGSGAGTTQLSMLNGRYTNAVSMTARYGNASTFTVGANQGTYVGTFRTVAAGQTDDTIAKRFVWNMYNRIIKYMSALETTNSWAYNSATVRQANGAATNQLAFVRGLDEDAVSAIVTSTGQNTTIGAQYFVMIGLDSTTVGAGRPYATTGYWKAAVATTSVQATATFNGPPGLGSHTLVWLEAASATGTYTIYGDDGGTGALEQWGITGTGLC